MGIIKKIRQYFAPTCECGKKMVRHHTDLVTGKVYWWCEKCDKVVRF